MGIDTTVIPLNASAVKADILATVGSDINLLGEIRQFALTIAGALSKSQLQAKGWAICDGTTATAQGISDATIENTPDLREKFLRHSANEVTGGTGGANTKDLSHLHQWAVDYDNDNWGIATASTSVECTTSSYNSSGNRTDFISNNSKIDGNYYTNKSLSTTQDFQPAYYDICYFIKVKV